VVDDPRLRRRTAEAIPWHRDRGLIGPVVAFAAAGAIVFGVLFADQLLTFVRGVDLETRYGRCSAETTSTCATVVDATVVAVEGQNIAVDEFGTRFTITRTAGAAASDFHAGQAVETVSVGGPVAELKSGGTLLFTRYYPAQDPIYWEWQGAVFAALAVIWAVAYAWGLRVADLRTPLAILSDRRRQ
jgi:hypothetical protein